MTQRGYVELTNKTYQRFKRYMKKFNGQTFYTSYPVRSRTAKRDVLVTPEGKTKLCF